MKRLAELSPGGKVQMLDGSAYTSSPIELSAAMGQAAQARGYLALLRAFVREIEVQNGRRDTLRGLVAPELSPQAFTDAMGAAERREAGCTGGAAAGA
jgi:hypothetical protein